MDDIKRQDINHFLPHWSTVFLRGVQWSRKTDIFLDDWVRTDLTGQVMVGPRTLYNMLADGRPGDVISVFLAPCLPCPPAFFLIAASDLDFDIFQTPQIRDFVRRGQAKKVKQAAINFALENTASDSP